jgi:hypothetical protein
VVLGSGRQKFGLGFYRSMDQQWKPTRRVGQDIGRSLMIVPTL